MVYCDVNDFGFGVGESCDLGDCCVWIGGVGVGYGLDNDWCVVVDYDIFDFYFYGFVVGKWFCEIINYGRFNSLFGFNYEREIVDEKLIVLIGCLV